MKPRLHHTTIFNLKMMGMMPVALSLILYPAIVKAEPAENLLSSYPQKEPLAFDFSSQAEDSVEDPSHQNKVTEKSIDSNSAHLLESSENQLSSLELPSISLDAPVSNTSTKRQGEMTPDSCRGEERNMGLSPPLLTSGSRSGVDSTPPELSPLLPAPCSPASFSSPNVKGTKTEIQPFQPAFSAQLPRGLRKIAGVTEENQKIPPASPISTGIKFLMPTPNNIVDVPATTVIVQFPVGTQVELRANGVLVDPSSIGRTETDASTNLVTQTWYGVSLKEGNNTISAQVVGGTEPPITVQVAVRGAPQQLTLETVESRIPADGRSTATIKGQLIDASGNGSNRDAVVTLIPTAGEFVGKDFKPDEPGFQVEAKAGQFTAILRSQLKAQTVTIRAIANNLEAFTQLQFETSLRPSLVTGVIDLRLGARGTDYYGSFRDFLPPDKDNRTQLDFRSAIFATGAIGEWLFTGAYNSSRNLNEDCNCDNRLFRSYQFSEQNYPVYGDSSKVDVVAPSIDSVYVRLERSTRIPGADPDYAMWGDYNTEEFARRSQQFTSITRQLHGFKANYNLGNLQITGLYGNHLEAFQRDTIAPDGTSGYYFLSRRILQPGSENVFIELEELNRPGTVLERKQLNRGPDYEIDYDRGTLLFREPILRTDIDQTGQVLVRRIVVSYQYESEDSDSNIYAGRLQYNLSRKLNQESWIGATYIQENQGVRDFQLYGADALISLGDRGKLIAEYAHSTNDSDVVGKVSGEAYRLEAEGQITNGIQGRAYYRFADTGFANNATISFVPGQTRYGAQVTAKLSSTTNVRAQYDHEDNFGIAPQPLDTFEELFAPRYESIPGSKVDNSLTTISAGIQQRLGSAIIDVDWIHRHREDRIPDSALSSNSDQLRSRFSVPIAKNLTFQAQNELSLSSQKDSVYPDRTIFGLNWAAIPGVNISLAQQFYTSGQYSGNSITSLSVNGEHKLGSDTTLTGRYSILGGANEMTTQGAIGLNNRWTIASGLRLNVAYEHVFGNFFGRTGAGQQYAQPFAVGQSASAIGFDGGDSYSVGLEYSDNPQFQASARYEHRSSSGGSNTVITAGATGKISPAITALVRYQQAGSSNQKLSGLGDTTNLKLGLAYRDPSSDKFNALLRYEYRKNPSTIPDTILLGSGTGSEDHTFALETIYAPNWQWEFYGKYALRSSTTYIASDLAGTSTVNLGQLRATYRLGYSWDLVGEARVISQSSYSETGFVLETGYYLTPNLRVSAGYVFGKVDDRDFSGTRSAGGAYLGISVKLNELFDGFGQQKPVPRQQQEPNRTEAKVTTDGSI
ncbi:TonB-dependent receptor [Nostoc sp. UHCC 0252]|uniref:TonB-dependent receptor n=1 Tax=Nostoc sp. UHCC 0252 TaxID=3110241 RepID=UPI002B21FC4E|nr:TonB-dependent receptor [Nostoc sp. UHCC 0252]MEA5602054.1 TonB-dependent receptor [Nostoc sp. UHCC 0252]